MRIKFTKNYTVDAKDGETYKQDDVVDVSDASAEHFCNRGVAVKVEEKAKLFESHKAETSAPKGPDKK